MKTAGRLYGADKIKLLDSKTKKLQVYFPPVAQLNDMAAQNTMMMIDRQTHINDKNANKATVNMSSPHE